MVGVSGWTECVDYPMRSVDLGLVAVRQFPEQPVSRPVSQSRFLANHV